MNRLGNAVRSVNEAAIGSFNRREVRRPQAIHVLSIGPIDFGTMVHDVLRVGLKSSLSIAPDCRDLWVTPKQESIQVAILHHTLSLFELEDACRFIRQRWPYARILVLRQGEGFLDDGLYDERVAPDATPADLLMAIERLTREWRARKPTSVEVN
jgi:hypothetical protein